MFPVVVVIILEASVLGSSARSSHDCPRGTHLLQAGPGQDVCSPCEDGKTFMTTHWHTNLECFNCTQIVDPQVEILVRGCSRTHDAVIVCKQGFYRKKARYSHQRDVCEKCFECKNPTKLCDTFYDTICCGSSDFEAFLNKDGVYVCREKSIVCTKGQYYIPHHNQCFTCPPNTYMSETSHLNTECLPCEQLGDNSRKIIIQQCNSTHSAVVACKPGYFRYPSQESQLSDTECFPCRTCQFVGRNCTDDHDTVCCEQSNMEVIDSSTGPICVPLPTTSDSAVGGVTDHSLTSDTMKPCRQHTFFSISNLQCLCCIEETPKEDLNQIRTCFNGCSELGQTETGNDVKNTSSFTSLGTYIIIIPFIMSFVSPALTMVAFFRVRWKKFVFNHQRGWSSYMNVLELKLFGVVYAYMILLFSLIVFATDTNVALLIICFTTIGEFVTVYYILYRFRCNKKSGNRNDRKNESLATTTRGQDTQELNSLYF